MTSPPVGAIVFAIVALLAMAGCQPQQQEVAGFVPDEQVLQAQDTGVRFVDVTDEAGIRFSHFPGARTSVIVEDYGSGVAWGDYDHDGWLDFFAVNSTNVVTDQAAHRGKLFRNQGDGTFADVTGDSGIVQIGLGMGAIWFDYNGDTRLDLFVTGVGWQTLYQNVGGGRFEDVTTASGLGVADGWSTGASVADYDLDGDLDLYVPHYVEFERSDSQLSIAYKTEYGLVPYTLNPLSYDPLTNYLYRNNGDQTFTEVGAEAGVRSVGRSLQSVFADLSGDGLPDLYVGNDATNDELFINQGDGTFQDEAEYARTADARGSMGIAVGDYDGDLDWDIWVTHWIAQDDALFRNMGKDQETGAVRFVDRIASDVGESSLDFVGWGVSFFDYDNDGWADVFVANGSTLERSEDRTQLVPMIDLLFRNRGAGRFTRANQSVGDVLNVERVSRGAAFGDYDNDGDLDMLVLSYGEGLRLLRNDGGNRRNWLTIELTGPPGNRQAVGAIVTASAGGRLQSQAVIVGSSYLSMNDTRLHFGLGDAPTVDWLETRWPDGQRQRVEDVRAGQFLEMSAGTDKGMRDAARR